MKNINWIITKDADYIKVGRFWKKFPRKQTKGGKNV